MCNGLTVVRDHRGVYQKSACMVHQNFVYQSAVASCGHHGMHIYRAGTISDLNAVLNHNDAVFGFSGAFLWIEGNSGSSCSGIERDNESFNKSSAPCHGTRFFICEYRSENVLVLHLGDFNIFLF